MMLRFSVLIIAAALALQAAASTPSWLMPNAWTVGIHLAQWLMKDQKKVYYVEVTSQGRDVLEAREQAFRMAVEQAVGSVISTDSRVQLGRLQKDEIIVYSSGFVEEYELVDTRQVGSLVQVKMKVWVSHNKLANRLLSESRAEGSVEGGRISTQIESFQQERRAADRLLNSVLADFPHRGFDMSVGRTRIAVDEQRRTILEIPVTVRWSRHYLDSMAEAIRSINQRSDCQEPGFIIRPPRCNARSRVAVAGVIGYFDDLQTWTAVNREMIQSRPQILLSLLDNRGQVQFQACFAIPEMDHHVGRSNGIFVDTGGGDVVIADRMVRTANLSLYVDSASSQNLDRAEVRAVRLQDCPGVRR